MTELSELDKEDFNEWEIIPRLCNNQSDFFLEFDRSRSSFQ